MGKGNAGTHIVALPALLLLAGCFGIPATTEPPPSVAVAPANTVNAVACTESGADTNKPKAREAVCLKELGKQASRKGNVLSLKLDNGATKTFRNDRGACKRDEPEKCVEYYLVGFYSTYSAAGAYLVHVQGFEGIEYTLVNARTGEPNIVEGVPRLAPDNSTFFIRSCDDAGCRISIKPMASAAAPVWERTGEAPDADDWDFVRWIDNDQVALRIAGKSKRCPEGDCEAILKRAGDSWTLEKLPKSGAK